MRIGNGGMDIFYIDESLDADTFALSAITIPFVRQVDGTWTIVWEDQFANVRDWRRRASKSLKVPVRKELKGQKLLSGRGRYNLGKNQFTHGEAAQVYRALLSDIGFLPDMSIITIVGNRQSNLFGHTRLEALVIALFQRMRMACLRSERIGLVFFDEGHGEYRKLYRKARVFLPTGSSRGGWGSGQTTRNMPLDNFTKDANIKESEHCFFIQLVDLVVHAAFLKIKAEQKTLTPWQEHLEVGTLYDAIPHQILNTNAAKRDPQGIVRL